MWWHMKFKNLFDAFRDEPYRLFFPFGIILGFFGANHWSVYAAGWIPQYSGFYHAALQMQGTLFCFVIGFLMTAIPRFSGSYSATFPELFCFAALTLGFAVLMTIGNWAAAQICYIFSLIGMARFIALRFRKRKAEILPPVEFIWIPIGILHGLAGASISAGVLLEWLPAGWFKAGRLLVEQGFLFSIVAGVGGFLAPRLLGRLETIPSAEVGNAVAQARNRKRRMLFYAAGGTLLFASFLMENAGSLRAAYSVRALVITLLFWRNRAWPFLPMNREGYVWCLWVSIGFVISGSWLVAIFPLYRKAFLHFVFLGGYSLMTFAVATMVILSHGGAPHLLKQPLPFLRWTAWGVVAALAFRVSAEFFPSRYFPLLAFAAFLWSSAAMIWIFALLPRILSVPKSPEEFERCHEEAKERIRNLSG